MPSGGGAARGRDGYALDGSDGSSVGSGVVLHSPQTLVPSSTGTTPPGTNRPSIGSAWCFSPRKPLSLRRRAPRPRAGRTYTDVGNGIAVSFCSPPKIGATRKTGGSNWGYKPPLLTRASRRGFSLCSSLSVIATLAAPKGAYLTNESSYSFTLSLSTAISCFSWSLIYFLIVSSLRPTVLT